MSTLFQPRREQSSLPWISAGIATVVLAAHDDSLAPGAGGFMGPIVWTWVRRATDAQHDRLAATFPDYGLAVALERLGADGVYELRRLAAGGLPQLEVHERAAAESAARKENPG